MKRILFFILFSLYALILFCASTPDRAAIDGLADFLQNIPREQLSNYGFNSEGDLAQVHIESAFRMKSITEKGIKQWKDSNQDIFISESLHLYPLSVNGSYRCMLAIDYTRKEWKAVSLGYKDLAVKMEQIRNIWKDKEITIIRVYPFKRYYFSVADAIQPNCTLIRFDNANQADYSRLSNLDVVLAGMQSEIYVMEGNHEK